MAYNYPNFYPYQIQQPQPPQRTGVIWVQGEAGAKSYLVAPNSTVYLWDSESLTIYVKSADPSGMPSIKVLDYKVRNTTPEAKTSNFVTRDELAAIQKEIERLKKEVGHNEPDADHADAVDF